MEVKPATFFYYLEEVWPDLAKKIYNKPISEMIKHLDIVCKISKSELYKLPVACARWQGILREMYNTNRNLEF